MLPSVRNLPIASCSPARSATDVIGRITFAVSLNVTSATESVGRSWSTSVCSDSTTRSRRPGSAIDPDTSTTNVSAASGRAAGSSAFVCKPTRTSRTLSAACIQPGARAPSTVTVKPLPVGWG